VDGRDKPGHDALKAMSEFAKELIASLKRADAQQRRQLFRRSSIEFLTHFGQDLQTTVHQTCKVRGETAMAR
jgi:hypothetical protein